MISPRTGFMVVVALTAISLIALIALGWRSLDRFEATIARVLRQASVYTAEQTAQRIQRDLKSPVFDLLEQVDHAAIRNFDVPRVAQTLKTAGSHHFSLIDTYFVWSFAAGSQSGFGGPEIERRVLFYAPSMGHTVRGPSAPGVAGQHGFFSNPELATILVAQSREWIRVQRPFALSYVPFEGRTYQVVYHYLYDALNRGQLGGIEGFLADAEHLRQNYFPDVAARWRPKAAQDPSSPTIAVSIHDTDGHEVFRSGRSLLEDYDAEAEFPFLFFDTDLFDSLSPYRPAVRKWTVRIGYEAGEIDTIARQQMNPQRWALLLASMVAAVGIALTARSAAREIRLSLMKSEFVASVSHDLKTPLAKIQLYADTLQSGRAQSQGKFDTYCRVISVQAKKLAQLIQGLMDFSRIEAGVREYAMDVVDLRDVLRATLDTFDQELSQDGRTTEVVLPGVPVRVMGSGDGLQQLFENLVSNALKYSPDERFLRVALTTVNRHALVEVTDRGIGVPRRERRRIFKKFYRGAWAAVAATGSGIGLAIVDHVVRAHGGSVAVRSGAERGTTFAVKLPLIQEASEVWGEANSGH